MTERTRDDRSTFTRITESIYWFLVLDVLLVIATAPTMVVWLFLAQDASNLILYALSSLFVMPAVAAALFAWRQYSQDPDPVPLRIFLRGYRVNLLDSLRIGLPAVLLLAVLATNIAFGDAAGTGSLTIAFVLMAVAVVLVATRALAICATFGFRFRDVLRLSVFTLLTMPLRTLSLLSLGVLMAGLSLFVGDYVFLLTASVLTFALWHSERPVLDRVRDRFVADDTSADEGPSSGQ